jgi:hypothetical protein
VLKFIIYGNNTKIQTNDYLKYNIVVFQRSFGIALQLSISKDTAFIYW